MKKEMLAMILAGGQGSRLGVFTKELQNQPYHSVVNTE